MLLDGLEDAYEAGKPMGAFAEETARSYQIGRAAQDEYALRSLGARQGGAGKRRIRREIVPVVDRQGDRSDIDEQPGRAKPEKIPTLKPAFAPDGTITAASSASISDGAAALVLTRESLWPANKGVAPVARIVGHATHAHAPALFTTAPVSPCARCWTASAGMPAMSICSRSTRRSPWWR